MDDKNCQKGVDEPPPGSHDMTMNKDYKRRRSQGDLHPRMRRKVLQRKMLHQTDHFASVKHTFLRKYQLVVIIVEIFGTLAVLDLLV